VNPLVPVVLFGVTAVGGATLAAFHFRKGWAPPLIAYGHGGLALGGLGTLTAAVHEGSATGLARWALAVLSLAVLAGAGFLVGFRLRGRPIPRAFIAIHGLVAAIGFGLLCAGVFCEDPSGTDYLLISRQTAPAAVDVAAVGSR
jgi:hypothetical protein